MTEQWKRVPYEAREYWVSNFGNVRNQDGRQIKGSVIQGYKTLNLNRKGKSTIFYVHKLVAQLFLDKRPEAAYVIHLDYDKLWNAHYNLKWVTRQEMIEHGRLNPNLKNRQERPRGNPKLKPTQVVIIKKLLKNPKNRVIMIARYFGVTDAQIYRIRKGENWGHVQL